MTSVDGLVSGIDTTRVIEGLLSFQRRPITRLESKIEELTGKKAAITTISARLLTLQLKIKSLSRTSTFNAVTTTSSNEAVLTASGTSDLTPGSYLFKVRQLAQSEQYTSLGFSDVSDAVGAGTLTIETGNGFVDRKTELDLLNGGNGVRRGSIRITDRAGNSAVVDLSTAITIDDVVEEINATAGINVSARIAGTGDTNPREGIVLTDGSGGSGNFRVEEVAGGNTATDLGILNTGVASSTIEGTQIVKLGGKLKLSALNDGLGVRTQSGNDLLITARDGDSFNVDLSSATTVQDVLDAINNATGNDSVTVSVSGGQFVATDSSTGGTFQIAEVGTGTAAADLGLAKSDAGGTITGDRVLADLNSILLDTINGTSSFTGGSISITNRNGTSATVDLSSAETLSEVIDLINANGPTGVTASYNSAGHGLLLRDSTGGASDFIVAESGGGTVAAQLGILQTVSSDTIVGTDLDPQYIGENTRLSTLNGGAGVAAGKIRVFDNKGKVFEVDLGQEKTIGDVIKDINGKASSVGSLVTAAVNSSGNGIILTDGETGSLLRVEEVNGGTTATDLNLLGSGTNNQIDGSFQKTLTITADDTLDDVVSAINALNLNVSAAVANDGSALTPFRLQVTGTKSGSLGRVLVDSGGGTNLAFSRTSRARDGVIFYGSAVDGSQPLVVRSNDNTYKNVVKGLTVTALAESSNPVNIAVTRNTDSTRELIDEVVEIYNELVAEIKDLTRVDADAGVRGPLVGDSVLRRIERDIANVFTRRVFGLPPGKNLASNLGIRFQSNGTLLFDSSKFDALLAEDPDAPRKIFTRQRALTDNSKLADFDNGQGVTAKSGPEIKVTTRDGSVVRIDISGDKTVRDLITSFNTAVADGGGTGKITLSISGDGRSLVLKDNTTGATALKVESQNSSDAFKVIGLNRQPDIAGGAVITGNDIDLTEDPGVALAIQEVLEDLLDTEDGAVTLRADFFQDEIDETQEEIERREEILALREATLRRQFAQLEVLLGQNQNTQQRLGAALTGLIGASF